MERGGLEKTRKKIGAKSLKLHKTAKWEISRLNDFKDLQDGPRSLLFASFRGKNEGFLSLAKFTDDEV